MEKTATKLKTLRELKQILMGLQRGRFATFEAITEPKMRKGGNPYHGQILKVAKAQVQWDVDYEKSMNAARQRDGLEARKVQPRKWGVHIEDTPFVFHVRKGETRGNLYVRMNVKKSLGYVYIDKRNGKTVDADTIHSFMPDKPKTELTWREYGIETLISITADGNTYAIDHDFSMSPEETIAAKAALDQANADRQEAKKQLATVS